VVDGAEIVFDDVFCCSDDLCDFAIFESLGDELEDSLLSCVGSPLPAAFAAKHSCFRYKSVASFTRLIPLLIPNRRKSRLKWAFTVRRAIFSCLAISELSQPCSSRSAICCSRGPSRMGLSFMSILPRGTEVTQKATSPELNVGNVAQRVFAIEPKRTRKVLPGLLTSVHSHCQDGKT